MKIAIEYQITIIKRLFYNHSFTIMEMSRLITKNIITLLILL